jgi:hypothetical protein
MVRSDMGSDLVPLALTCVTVKSTLRIGVEDFSPAAPWTSRVCLVRLERPTDTTEFEATETGS